jgi:hypothetical protein
MIRLGLPCPRSVQARCVPSGESEVSPTVSTLPRSARIARTFAFAGGCVSGEAARAGKASAGKQSVATQNRADKARRDTELMRRMLTVFAPAGRARGPWRGTAYGSLGTLRQGRQIALPRSALDQRSRRKSGSPGSFTGDGPYMRASSADDVQRACSMPNCAPMRPGRLFSYTISTPFIDRFRNACYC